MTTTLAPIYFATKKNARQNKAEQGNVLHITAKYGKISVYLNHGNGGYDVNVRLLNSRGGSKAVKGVTGYHLAGDQTQRACSLQDWWKVANHTHGLAKVGGNSKKLIGSGKLNSLAFSVTALSAPSDWTPFSAERCPLLLHAYYRTPTNAKQHMARLGGAMGYEVAVWEEYPMTTRIMLFNADGLNIGSISHLALNALIDSGLLDRENTPAENLAPIHGPCIECGTHPRAIGIFCRCCFDHLRACDAKWAAAWYGRDWDEACEQARMEVNNAAD